MQRRTFLMSIASVPFFGLPTSAVAGLQVGDVLRDGDLVCYGPDDESICRCDDPAYNEPAGEVRKGHIIWFQNDWSDIRLAPTPLSALTLVLS